MASLGGNVTLRAGEVYTQSGSSVVAQADKNGLGGDVDIQGRKVLIQAAEDSANSSQTSKFSKTALGGSVSVPVVGAAQSALNAAKAGTKTEDTRMQALAGLNAALAGMDAVILGRSDEKRFGEIGSLLQVLIGRHLHQPFAFFRRGGGAVFIHPRCAGEQFVVAQHIEQRHLHHGGVE